MIKISEVITSISNKYKSLFLDRLQKKNYLVGVSGGPDSMFLLSNLLKMNYSIVVCHINYNLRKESEMDENLVKDFCQQNKIPLEVKRVKEKITKNIQAKARAIRIDFFLKIAKKYNINCLVLAHHLNDHLETYLLQKQRKITVNYYGLKFKTIYQNLHVYRPLIDFTKNELIEYLLINKIKFSVDVTNYSNKYTRNIIRKKLLNLSEEELFLILKKLKIENFNLQKLQKQLEVAYSIVFTQKNKLLLYLFRQLPPILQKTIVYKYLYEHALRKYFDLLKINFKEINKTLISIKQSNCFLRINSKVVLIIEYDAVYLSKTPQKINYYYEIKNLKSFKFLKLKGFFIIKDSDFQFYKSQIGSNYLVNSFFLTKKIVIKTNKGKEIIKTYSGTKKINKIFINHKIPLKERINWPVILDNNEVLLIPFLEKSKKLIDYQCMQNDQNKFLIFKSF